jgi:hypothetical protein
MNSTQKRGIYKFHLEFEFLHPIDFFLFTPYKINVDKLRLIKQNVKGDTMRSFKCCIIFLLSLLLLFSLFACTKTTENPEVDQNTPNSQKQEETKKLNLALPNGTCATICSKIPTEELEISLTTPIDPEDAESALLNGTVDFALLSPQNAADLYRSGNMVQIVAVVSLGDADSMECLVGRTEYLEKNPEFLSLFFAVYEKTFQEENISGSFFATGWDMLDLVQQSLEAQFEKQPGPSRSVPDGNFYYIPS